MTTVLLRPTSVVATTGSPAGANSDVSDNSDATWMSWLSTGGSAIYDMASLTGVPAGAQIRSVQLVYRNATTVATAFVTSRLWEGYPSGNYYSIGYGYQATTTIKSFFGPVLATNPKGQAWTIADVNNLVAAIYVNPNTRIYDVWLQVVYNEKPVTSAVTPSGAVTSTVKPTIGWTYTDPDGDAQERYQIKVFTSEQYTAGGFNPDISSPVWNSGVVFSDSTVQQVGINLQNGVTYRAYVQTADAGSGGRASGWVFSTFTIAVTVPATPSLSVLGNPDTSVTLTVGGVTAGNGVVVERSDDGGTSWNPVRGAYAWTATLGSFIGTDYEAPLNQSTQYRAWQYSLPGGNLIGSAYSTVRPVTVPNNLLRLKDVENPGYQIAVSFNDNLKVASVRLEGAFDPLGSSAAVVLVDSTPGGDRIPLPLYFKSDANYRAFVALRATGHVLQLVTDTADQWYVQLTGEMDIETQASPDRKTAPFRTVSGITAVAVAAPADSTPVPGS